MSSRLLAVAFATALAGATALAQSPQQPLNQQDKQFMEMAAQVNMTSAHMGKLAQERATREDVKEFGQMLVNDHTQAYQELSDLANRENVSIPRAIDQKHQKEIDRFNNLTGDRFDKQFLNHEIQAHKKVVDRFQNEAQAGNDPDVKAYAAKYVPVLEKHLNRAQSLYGGGTISQTSQMPANEAGSERYANEPASERYESNANLPAQTSEPEASRTEMPTATTAIWYGTVEEYEPGRVLALKVQDRAGKHVYELTGSKIAYNVPAGLSLGSKVKVVEITAPEGRSSIWVEQVSSFDEAQQQRH